MNRFRSSNKPQQHLTPRNDTTDTDAGDDVLDDDDVSLLCSPPPVSLSTRTKTSQRTTTKMTMMMQPTQLSSPPERIPIDATTIRADHDTAQITIFPSTTTTAAAAVLSPTVLTITTNGDKTTDIIINETNVHHHHPHSNHPDSLRPPRATNTRTHDATRGSQPRHSGPRPIMANQQRHRLVVETRLTTTTTTIPSRTTTDTTAAAPISSTRRTKWAESPRDDSTTHTHHRKATTVQPASFSMWSPHPTPGTSLTSCRNAAATATTTKKGICLDLSHVFGDAASSHSLVRPTHEPTSRCPPVETMESDRPNHDESDDPQPQEEWAEKQVDILTKWMNYLFYPTEGPGTASAVPPPEALALRTLVIHQRMAQGRAAARELFQSPEQQRIREILRHEIGRNKIALRPDRDDLCANIEHRNRILSVLLSYSTPWLRLGLETMCQTVISPDRPALLSPAPRRRAVVAQGSSSAVPPMSRLKWTLRNFILQNVLSDDKVLAKYTGGKCKVPSGPFEDRYRTELRTVVTYRLLVLILFLDRAKMANLLDQAPNLFTSTSTVKSTREVLLYICRNFLKAEGDFTKHLSRLGIKVHYQQEAVDELDFTVTNLRVDLNDGVRLTRMTELLTGVTLLPKLRLPAVSRLQKLYNVKLAIDHLTRAGVPISDTVAPYHIVDGHREMVLKLLWSVVAHCCLQALLSVEQVEAEIARIQRYHGMASQAPVHNDRCEDDVHELQRVLLRWCNLVCCRFGRRVCDFTQSFSDGKTVCLLIHYYHPTLIRLKEIKMTSLDPLAKYSKPEKLLSNERDNGRLANSRMSDLGGIPEVIPICDTNHPPEEKAVVFCLTFLCSRLITSSVEIRACLIIQYAYRNYCERRWHVFKVVAARKLLFAWRSNKDQYYAARQRRYYRPVQIIEQFVLTKRDKLCELRLKRLDHQKANKAAIHIQVSHLSPFKLILSHSFLIFNVFSHRKKIYRGYSATKQVEAIDIMRKSVIVLQCMWRQELARRQVLSLLIRSDAAIILQRAWRAFQCQDLLTNAAATHIQRMFRGYCGRVAYLVDILDIIAVQSCVRRFIALQHYKRIKAKCTRIQNSAIIVIQSMSRRWIAQRKIHQLKYDAVIHRHVITIQTIWRAFKCRMVVNLRRLNRRRSLAATSIQATTRMYLAQACLIRLKSDVVEFKSANLIQALWRGKLIRSHVAAIHFAATNIQAAWRRRVTIRHIHCQHFCAATIQSRWRQVIALKSFQRSLFAIRLLQSVCRRFLTNLKYEQRQTAARKIQCTCRKWTAMMELQRQKRLLTIKMEGAMIIQRFWRGFSIKNTFSLVKRDAVVIQAFYRSYHDSQRFKKLKKSAVTGQSMIRQFQARKRLQKLVDHKLVVGRIVRVQSIVRRWLAYRILGRHEDAIVRVQCLARKFFARCELRNLKHLKQRAVSQLSATLTIQRLYRGMRGRLVARQESSARKVQKTWRCYTVHVEYMLSILAAIEIQAAMRRFLVVYSYKCQYSAVVCIQSFTRLALTRIQLRRESQCAITLQSFVRTMSSKKVLVRKRLEYYSAVLIQREYRKYLSQSFSRLVNKAAMTLQRYARGFIVRMQLETEIFAAVEIQRMWLGFVAREYFAGNVLAAIRLQSYFRGEIGRSLAHRVKSEYIADRFLAARSATRIQQIYRRYRQFVRETDAAAIIQRKSKCFLSRRKFGKVQQGILSTQCIARGFLVRRRRAKKVIVQAQRIGLANKKALAAPNMILRCRTDDALKTLVNSKSLAEIMDAVCVLEVATRLSEACCTTFAEATAPDNLFSLIQTCNRSLPHLKLLQSILLTLSNVARFDKLVPAMASLLGVEVFLDLLQMFRDKEHVFCLVVSLLERIIRSNVQKMVRLRNAIGRAGMFFLLP